MTTATTSATTELKVVLCDKPAKKRPEIDCGALVAVRVPGGYEIVCPRCGGKHVLRLE